MWCEQATLERSWYVNTIVACCYSAKLCAHAARDFRSQQGHSRMVTRAAGSHPYPKLTVNVQCGLPELAPFIF